MHALRVILPLCVAVAVVISGAAYAAMHGSPHARPTASPTPSGVGQQLIGLAVPDPSGTTAMFIQVGAAGVPQLEPSTKGGAVGGDQRWWADQLSDGTYTFIDPTSGTCLDVDTAAGDSLVSQRSCDQQVTQRWRHQDLGKNSGGQEIWQLRNAVNGLCVTVDGPTPQADATLRMLPCESGADQKQSIAFWPAY